VIASFNFLGAILSIFQIRFANEYAKQQVAEIDDLQKHADVTLSYLQRLESSAADGGGNLLLICV
jgi:hypothetical protein